MNGVNESVAGFLNRGRSKNGVAHEFLIRPFNLRVEYNLQVEYGFMLSLK